MNNIAKQTNKLNQDLYRLWLELHTMNSTQEFNTKNSTQEQVLFEKVSNRFNKLADLLAELPGGDKIVS